MKKTFKKILCTLLVVVMCMTSAPLSGFVDFDFTAEATTEYKVGDIIEFGSYPQSEVTDPNIIDVLNSTSGEWISYGYYSGSGSWKDGNMVASDYMRYKDVVYESVKYRGVVFDSYRPACTGQTSSTSNKRQADNGYYTDIIYWFKYEPIKWRVLDATTGMVMSEIILDSQPYNNYVLNSGLDKYGWSAYWGDSSKTHYANNYAESSIRQWLNNDFYNIAFSTSQKNMIELSTLDNSAVSESYSAYNSISTSDKMFLLSTTEVRNTSYGFLSSANESDSLRRAQGSDYAKSQGLYVYASNDYAGNSYWFLRTAGDHSHRATEVYYDGSFGSAAYVYQTTNGIRPAMCVDLDAVTNKKVFPAGYNFEDDSYGFDNPVGAISRKYFWGIYGYAKSELMLKKHKNAGWGGLCFGLVYTTAAILQGYPSISQIHNKNEVCENLRSTNKNSIVNIECKYDEFGNEISLLDYIKYAYVYQWSWGSRHERTHNYFNNYSEFSSVIKNAINNNSFVGIKIDTTKNSHIVLAVGYEETKNGLIVYVDDPNFDTDTNKKELQKFIADENGWSYSNSFESYELKSDWGSQNPPYLWYQSNFTMPYTILTTGLFTKTNDEYDENYIERTESIDSDKLLFYTTLSNRINAKEYIDISDSSYGNIPSEESKDALYWINDKTVTINDIKERTEMLLAGNNEILSATVAENSEVSMTIDGSNINSEIITEEGQAYSISLKTITTDEENNNIETEITVMGKATDDKIIATQTETGLIVTGVEDGTITLSKNDEVIDTQTITDAESDIEITYDKNGESDSLEVEYEAHEHTYNSVVTKEATCTETGVETFTCECNDQYTETIGANGHTDSEWIVDKDSTCSAEGSKHIECTVCGEVLKTESTTKLPHKYSSVVTKPTCETGGYTTYTCSCGDTYTGDKTPAKGHDYAEGICKNCGDSKIDNCSCSCHKGGISGFFFKIILFFQKLFRTNKICSCGVAHY